MEHAARVHIEVRMRLNVDLAKLERATSQSACFAEDFERDRHQA